MSAMKFLKILLIVAGVLLVVIAAGVAYVASTFDPNQYKPQIIKAVKEHTQRTLKLDGDITLSFFPGIGARLGKAALSERASDKEFAAVEDLRVAVKLMPLLSRQVVVDAVEVKGLRANLVKHKDTTSNFDDLTGAPQDKKARPAADSAAPVTIDIDHVRIENAAFTYTDQAAGIRYAVSRANIATGRIANGVPTDVEISLAGQSDKPKAAIETKLKARFTFDVEKQRYALQGLDLRATGDAAGMTGIKLDAKGDLEVRQATKELSVTKLVLKISAKEKGADMNAKLDVPRLSVTKDKVEGSGIVAEVARSEEKSKLAGRIELPSLAGNSGRFEAAQMIVKLDLQQDGASVTGGITSPVSGSIESQRFELPKLSATLAMTDPKLPKSPITAALNGALQVDVHKETANLRFATKIDESTINGRAGLAKFSPPFYTFDVNVDKLDADRYLPQPDPKAKPPQQPGQAKQGKQAERPFDLAALKGLNASGSVKVGSLKISNIKASNVRLDIKATDGRVDVSPMSANLYQGSLAGALSVNAADSSFGVRQNLSGVDVGPLLRDAADMDTLEGRGNVVLDVTARGNTVALLKKSLNGTAAVNLSDGAVKGINIAQSIRSAKAKLATLRGEQVQAADTSQQTDFSSLKATFNIRNGLAHNDDLSLQSPLLRVGGAGDIDIGQDRINYVVKATIVGTTKGQGGRGVDELAGVTVPVKVSGPLAKPSYGLDFSSMVSGVAKQKAQEALANELQRRMGGGATKEGGKEGAKGGSAPADVLKGLFGR